MCCFLPCFPERTSEDSAAQSCAIFTWVSRRTGLQRWYAVGMPQMLVYILGAHHIKKAFRGAGQRPAESRLLGGCCRATACGQVALRLYLFQGENQLYCYEVMPQQPALSPGEPSPSLPPHHGFHPPLTIPCGFLDSDPVHSGKCTARGSACPPASTGCHEL